MLDKDDTKFMKRIKRVVKGNTGISLEEIAKTLEEPTDLVLNYIESTDSIVEYEPNQFKIKEVS